MKYILFLLFILSFISCSRPKVNVAIMTKLEAGSIIGTSEINAAKLFLINNPDSRISFIPYDDGWNPEIVEKIYDDIRKDNIDIILTSHTSSCAVKLIDKVNSDKVFMLVTGATTDELSGKNDYIFRSVQSVESEQRSIAEYINRMENI